jgi:hypothetical protein
MRVLLVALVLLASTGIQAQAPVFARGQTVRVRPSLADEPVTTLLLTIVAGPNDRIHGADSRLLVNDVAVTGFSPDFIARVSQVPPRTIPAGHYYVMGEQRVNEDISEYWGQHAGTSLEAF